MCPFAYYRIGSGSKCHRRSAAAAAAASVASDDSPLDWLSCLAQFEPKSAFNSQNKKKMKKEESLAENETAWLIERFFTTFWQQ